MRGSIISLNSGNAYGDNAIKWDGLIVRESA